MTVCYLCSGPATISCPVCGRGACSNHIQNHVRGYSAQEKYLCVECAKRTTENAEKLYAEVLKKQEAEKQAHAEAVRLREKAAEDERKFMVELEAQAKRHADAVNREVVSLAERYYCRKCEGHGWIKKGWFFIEYSEWKHRSDDLPIGEKEEYYRRRWHDAYTKTCPDCDGKKFLPGMDAAIERLLGQLVNSGLDRRVLYRALGNTVYRSTDLEPSDNTLLYRLRDKVQKHWYEMEKAAAKKKRK